MPKGINKLCRKAEGNKMKFIKVSLATLLGVNGVPMEGINPGILVEQTVWEDGDDDEIRALVPVIDPTYRFRKEMVRDFMGWRRFNKEALFLYGPTGCGKSSFVTQMYARLGVPLYRMTINEDTELAEIFGHYVLEENGQTVFRYGPGSLAAKYGYPLLLDEVGRGRPGVIVGMNGMLDGVAFTITGNGETVTPHPNFRPILTDNTNLAGDESGNYNTAMIQDKSILDRIGMSIKVGYPVDEEKAILTEELARIAPEDNMLTYWFDQEKMQVSIKDSAGVSTGVRTGAAITREDFIQGILQVRDMVRKQSRDCGNETAAALERTMSVRSLQRWVSYCVAFIGAPNQGVSALHYALERSLTHTCTPSTKIAIHEMVKAVFGVSEVLETNPAV
jgi:cobaltochelatase CobS